MPSKQQWTVRVVVFEDDRLAPTLSGVWVEQLRYMGVMRELPESLATTTDTVKKHTVYEFSCPNRHGMDTKVWAEANAARMQSFGFLAAATPKWGG
jgi:hypothetical protein